MNDINVEFQNLLPFQRHVDIARKSMGQSDAIWTVADHTSANHFAGVGRNADADADCELLFRCSANLVVVMTDFKQIISSVADSAFSG